MSENPTPAPRPILPLLDAAAETYRVARADLVRTRAALLQRRARFHAAMESLYEAVTGERVEMKPKRSKG